MEMQSYSQWKYNHIPNGKTIVFPLGRQSYSYWEGNRIPNRKTIALI